MLFYLMNIYTLRIILFKGLGDFYINIVTKVFKKELKIAWEALITIDEVFYDVSPFLSYLNLRDLDNSYPLFLKCIINLS